TVRLWDAATGEARGILEGHSDSVRAVVFSPDGSLLASASYNKTVRLWDTATGEARGTLEGHSDSVTAVVFSPDGSLLASASYDKTVRLWDAATGEARGTLEGHSDWVRAVVFSPDGSLLASASNDNTVRLYVLDSGELLHCFNHAYSQYIKFSLSGTQLIVDGKIYNIQQTSPPVSISQPAQKDALYAINQEGQWITWNSEKVLWLPPNRRPGIYATQDSTIVIGNGSGRITFIYCNPAVTPF
ncbi:MAG: hypothetical protein LQ351_008166, partial [Letrouitia transgressa]